MKRKKAISKLNPTTTSKKLDGAKLTLTELKGKELRGKDKKASKTAEQNYSALKLNFAEQKKEHKTKDESPKYQNSKIKNDLVKTLITIVISLILLFTAKYLQVDLWLNKLI